MARLHARTESLTSYAFRLFILVYRENLKALSIKQDKQKPPTIFIGGVVWVRQLLAFVWISHERSCLGFLFSEL